MQNSAFKTFLNNIKVKHKLAVSYLSIFLALALAIFIGLHFSAKAILDQATYSATQMFDQTKMSLSNSLEQYLSSSFSIGNLTELSDMYDASKRTTPANEITTIRHSLEKAMTTILASVNYKSFRIYTPDQFGILRNGKNYFSYSDVSNEAWFLELNNRFNSSYASFMLCSVEQLPENNGSQNDIISYASILKNPTNYLESRGILRIDIPAQYIRDILSNNSLYKDFVSFIQDDYGNIIIADEVNSDGPDPNISLAVKEIPNNTWSRLVINGRPFLARKESLSKYNIVLVNVVAQNQIYAPLTHVRRMALVFGGIALLLSFFITMVLSNSISKRVSNLEKTMNSVHSGRFSKETEVVGKDEIGSLATCYNRLVDIAEKEISESYQRGVALKDAELRSLQNQINPHFLYNSLDMIKYFAGQRMTEETEKAITSLVVFYRLSLSKGKRIASIDDELRLIDSYITIQNMRYNGGIHYKCDISDSIRCLSIPNLIFQPIVENSIMHGIREKENKSGTIFVSGTMSGNDVWIEIRDDGIGMTPAVLDELNTQFTSSIDPLTKTGYGLKNVHERLLLFFGREYGLRFKQADEGGTIAQIHIQAIPYSLEDPEEI